MNSAVQTWTRGTARITVKNPTYGTLMMLETNGWTLAK